MPCRAGAWWRHRMETFSVLLGLCAVTGEFPAKRPVTQSFDVFFDLRLNKRLSKWSRRRWFETPSHSLWRHCNGTSVTKVLRNKMGTLLPSRGISCTRAISVSINVRKCEHALCLPQTIPDSKVHGANMGPIWGQQGPGWPHVGPMNFAIWEVCTRSNVGPAVLLVPYIARNTHALFVAWLPQCLWCNPERHGKYIIMLLQQLITHG